MELAPATRASDASAPGGRSRCTLGVCRPGPRGGAVEQPNNSLKRTGGPAQVQSSVVQAEVGGGFAPAA
jgi:hypothetical protein